jgi:hypothetical protein
MVGVPIKVNYGDGLLTEVQMVEWEAEYIASFVKTMPENGKMVEWGSGGSTLKWLENLPETCSFISIEHNRQWYDKVTKAIQIDRPKDTRYKYLHVPEEYIEHGYGSLIEEHPTGLQNYINPLDVHLWDADLFLIDGIGRAACLMAVLLNKTSRNPVIFIHDYVGREEWYSWAVQFCTVETFLDKDPDSTLARIRIIE